MQGFGPEGEGVFTPKLSMVELHVSSPTAMGVPRCVCARVRIRIGS